MQKIAECKAPCFSALSKGQQMWKLSADAQQNTSASGTLSFDHGSCELRGKLATAFSLQLL